MARGINQIVTRRYAQTPTMLHSTDLCSFVARNPGLYRKHMVCCVRHTYREGKYQNVKISFAFRLPAAHAWPPQVKIQGTILCDIDQTTARSTMRHRLRRGRGVAHTSRSILMAIQSICDVQLENTLHTLVGIIHQVLDINLLVLGRITLRSNAGRPSPQTHTQALSGKISSPEVPGALMEDPYNPRPLFNLCIVTATVNLIIHLLGRPY